MPKKVRNRAEKIRELWATGEYTRAMIARDLGCTRANVSQIIRRAELTVAEAPWKGNGAPVDATRDEKIVALWKAGQRNKAEIARRVGCTRHHVAGALERAERGDTATVSTEAAAQRSASPRTCQRPDVGNGLKPCGRPLHEIGGEKLGVCKHHWDIGKPVPGQRNTRSY